ncbi:hypothetical protein ACQ4LE_007445 [Meloidogyne hapla]
MIFYLKIIISILAVFSQSFLTISNKIEPTCKTNQNLKFSSCKDGLPWPIEDFTSISVLITHGIHCIDIIQQTETILDEHLEFHKEHCLELMKQIYKFFKENTNYAIPKDLCNDFRLIAFPGGRVRRGLWSCGWGGDRRFKRGCGRKKRDLDGLEMDENDFKEMATRHFELLLLKEKKGAKLSETEKKYLEGSRSPQAIRMAALGIYCKFEAYERVVKDVINGKIIFN